MSSVVGSEECTHQLIPPSKTLLEEENIVSSCANHIIKTLAFEKMFSLNSKSCCARPLANTNIYSGFTV